MFLREGFVRRHKILSALGLLVVLLSVLAVWRLKGPYRFYKVDFVKPALGTEATPGVLEVGVAKRDISPDMAQYDPWTDADNDNKYNPDKGDTYTDRNGNGKFDGVWLAGFNHNRPAKEVHDPIWTRAIAFRNNGVTVVLVTIDSIGIFHEEFITIRKSLDPSLNIDHVMFSSKHIHEVPDTMGIWSYPYLVFSKDKAYMSLVRKACKEAVEEAVANLAPAEMICAQTDLDPEGFEDDSRDPQVFDTRLSCARFVKHGTDETIATFVCWGNHPETLGGSNPGVTADFCHYLRRGLEQGVPAPAGAEGFGGMCLYFQGNVGGLMTQLHTTVPHRSGAIEYRDASYEKAQALGENLAITCAKLLRSDDTWVNESPRVAVAAKTIYVPFAGAYKYALMVGLVHPGWFWGKARTEINAFRIGEVEILTTPGELYPEIAIGGVEAPEGQDFPIGPVEVPPLYGEMGGKMNLMIGLANDEIGYMLPKSQWDVEPPFAYGRKKAQYGEENSGGPDIGPTYHREARALLERLHAAL